MWSACPVFSYFAIFGPEKYQELAIAFFCPAMSVEIVSFDAFFLVTIQKLMQHINAICLI